MSAAVTLPAQFTHGWISATNKLTLRTSAAPPDGMAVPSNWIIGTGGLLEGILVAEVDVGGFNILELTTDRTLMPGNPYSLVYADFSPDAITFLGPIESAPAKASETADMEDIDVPLAGPYPITSAGDYALKGGIATVQRIVVDLVLTLRGTIPWSAGWGADLAHKAPRPIDLGEEAQRIRRLILGVPRVRTAKVTLTWDAGHLIAELAVGTDAGLFEDAVKL